MKRHALAMIGLLLLPLPAQAAPAPSQLRGKSIIVSWTESRAQKVGGDPTMRHVNIRSTLSTYISTAGNAFRRLSLTSPSGTVGSIEHVGAGGSARGLPVALQFQGRSVVSMVAFSGGARRTIIDFDESYTSCSARVALAKEAGSGGPIRFKSLDSGTPIEVHGVLIGGVSCSVKSGNVFGN